MINAKNEGVKERKVQIAKKMLKKGMLIDEIMELTNLSEEEIKKLKWENILWNYSVRRIDNLLFLWYYSFRIIISCF